jgi:hypothetical protein
MAAINKGGVNAQKAENSDVFLHDLHNRLNDVLDALDGTDSTDITLAGTLTTSSHGALQSAEHGAGAVSTAFAPRTYRRTENGHIITEIHVDLTGLKVKGTAEKDAIGLATGAAYIGRYVVATYGIVYKIEMICVEVPAGTNTTTDIDLGAEDVGTTAYDGGVDDVILNTAALVAGEIATNAAPALTANDYIYLIEGDTAASTGTYTAGQYIIRFYGHALLS